MAANQDAAASVVGSKNRTRCHSGTGDAEHRRFLMTHHTADSTAYTKRLRRRANIVLVVIVFLAPIAIIGARQSVDLMRITPEKWADKSHVGRIQFDQFRDHFEGNDVVYVSWHGCTIDDPRLNRLGEQLLAANRLPEHPGVSPFERVVTGPGTLQRMMGPPTRLTRDTALDRLEGFLVGPDHKTSCAVVVLTYEGNERRRSSIEHLKSVACDVASLSPDELIVAGPPNDGVAIDAESVRGVNVFSTGATIVAAILCCWCLRAWRLSALVIGVACLGQAIVLAAIHYSGMTLDAILIVSPALIFVLTVSAGIHFINYFQAQPASATPEQAIRGAMNEGWRPCWMATATTAVGLCSLAISGIAPVAAFGQFSAAALLMSVGLLMCVLPNAVCPAECSVSCRMQCVNGLRRDSAKLQRIVRLRSGESGVWCRQILV